MFELERGGASFLVRVDRFSETAEPAEPEVAESREEAQLSLFADLPSAPPVRGPERQRGIPRRSGAEVS